MPRVRYVRASRYTYGKLSGKPAVVFDCPFDSLNWEDVGQARICV